MFSANYIKKRLEMHELFFILNRRFMLETLIMTITSRNKV